MKTWKPKTEHPYWMINSRFEVKMAMNNGSKKSTERIRAGNCFKNPSKAEELLKIIKEQTRLTRWEHLKRALLG